MSNNKRKHQLALQTETVKLSQELLFVRTMKNVGQKIFWRVIVDSGAISATVSSLCSLIWIVLEVRNHKNRNKKWNDENGIQISKTKSAFIVQLALSDLFHSLMNWVIVIQVYVGDFCNIQATLMEYFMVASIFWNLATVVLFFYMTRASAQKEALVKVSRSLFGVQVGVSFCCWTLPLFNALLLWTLGILGGKGNATTGAEGCWFNGHKRDPAPLWEYLTFGFEYIVISWIVCLGILVFYLLTANTTVLAYRAMKRLFMGFALALLLVWSFPIIHQILISLGQSQISIYYLQVSTEPLLGFFGLMTYLWAYEPWKKKGGEHANRLLGSVADHAIRNSGNYARTTESLANVAEGLVNHAAPYNGEPL